MSSKRIPSLDGIRAVAVVLVIASHAYHTITYQGLQNIQLLFQVGNLGVRIFFVLSGFLITSLLLHEREKKGFISLKNFYMRRTIRIFPAFYFFLLCMVFSNYSGWVDLSFKDFFHAFTYTGNYYYGGGWELAHLWSLAVEEQFYLLWPLSLVLLGNKKGLWFAFAVILVVPCIRVIIWEFIPSQRDGIGESFQTVCDALATGCLLAGIRYYWGEVKIAGRQLNGVGAFFVVFVVLLINYNRDVISMSYTVGNTIMNVGIAFLIDWAVRRPDSLVGQLLNCKFSIYIGTLSYSLYLWQQPFLNRSIEAVYGLFPINILLACLCAVMSYHFIEKPFINLRSRYH